MLKTNRGLIKYILLSFVTFGIYPLVVMSEISSDINLIVFPNDGKRTTHYCLMLFLFSWLTLGIYPFVWYHKLSARIGNQLAYRNINYSFGASSFWGWYILGAIIVIGPLVYMHKLLKAMNLLCADYNAKH